MVVVGALQEPPERRLDAEHIEVLPARFQAPHHAGVSIEFKAGQVPFKCNPQAE